MTASALQTALRARGLRCQVEGRERLALVAPDDEAALAEVVRLRNVVLDEGKRHGFTHVALDLPRALSGAALRRD